MCQCMVYCIPIRIPEIRERRVALKVDMDLTKLLSVYFDTKAEYKNKKDTLIEKALLLEAELNQKENS
jgi:hypothetical protein